MFSCWLLSRFSLYLWFPAVKYMPRRYCYYFFPFFPQIFSFFVFSELPASVVWFLLLLLEHCWPLLFQTFLLLFSVSPNYVYDFFFNCSTVLGCSILIFLFFISFHFVKFLLNYFQVQIFSSTVLSLVMNLLKTFFIEVTVVLIPSISFRFLQFSSLCLYNPSVLA